MNKELLKTKIADLCEHEARSCSMEVITPLYVYRYWSGQVPLQEITSAMREMKKDFHSITIKGIY